MGLFQPNIEKLKMQKNVAGLVQATGNKEFRTRALAVEALGQVGGPQAVGALLALLQDPNSGLRETAVRALGVTRDPVVVEPLVAVLRQYPTPAAEALIEIGLPAIKPVAAALRDSGKRQLAAQVLDSIGRPADPETEVWYAIAKKRWTQASRVGAVALEPLLSCLHEEFDLNRAGVVYALGELRDPRAAEALIAILQEKAEEAKTRRSAAEGLGKIGDVRAVAALSAVLQDRADALDLRRDAAAALAKLGPPALDGLLAILKDQTEPPELRQGAAQALATLGPAAVDGLIAVLPDAALGPQAVYALAKIGDARAVEPLLALHQGTRQAGVLALGGFHDERALEPLIAALADKDVDYAQAAARALGDLGDQRALEPLIAALERPEHSYFLIEAVAEALGKIGGPRAVEALLALYQHGEREEGQAFAAKVLANLNDLRAMQTLVGALCATWPSTYEAAQKGLVAHPTAALEPLQAALNGENVELAVRAAGVLGQIGAPAVEVLLGALAPGSDRVGWAIASALGEIRDPRATEALLACGTDTNLRQPVMHALAKIADPRTVEPLIAALHDENQFVRHAAAEGLGAIGDARAVSPLLDALVNDRCAVKGPLTMLGALAVEPLVRFLQEGRARRDVVVQILGDIADPRATPALLAALHDPSDYVRQYAVEALGKMGVREAVEPLCVLLGDRIWFVREAAAVALGRIADPRASRALRGALNDEYKSVGEAARESLGQLRLQTK